MRENWDFVSVENYRADMAESSAIAAGIITQLCKRAEQAERALAEVVIAAGGSVKVPDSYLSHTRRQPKLTIRRNDADLTIEFRAHLNE